MADPAVLPELAGLARPRWRPEVPALWRDATTIQLGDDVIVPCVGREHVAWLARLDGVRTADEVAQDLPLDHAEARRLLRALRAAAALDDADRVLDAARWAPVSDRAGVERRFTTALRVAGDSAAAHRAMAARDRTSIHVDGAGPLAVEVLAALDLAGLRLAGSPAEAGLHVLAGPHHPDAPPATDVPDVPHLPVGAHRDRAVVGPLVVPGRTGCLRCAHLHHRDADPAWPLLAVQWGQAITALATHPAEPLLDRLVAAHAALLVRAWAEADDAHWAGFAVELRLPLVEPTRLPRPPHPLCGCLWPGGRRRPPGEQG